MLRLSKLLVGLTLVAAIAFLWSEIDTSLARKPFEVPDRTKIDEEQIGSLLEKVAPNGSLQPGSAAEIALLHLNSGRAIRFSVVEGTFSASSIEPMSTWSAVLQHPSMLVSSADERLSNDGGISYAIGIGCSLKPLQIELATGRARVDDCSGSYKTSFPQLRYVASAIILAWNAIPGKRNCNLGDRSLSSTDQGGYALCLQSAIESALGSLLSGPDIGQVETLVLPALGTGTGRLSKDESYSAEMKAILGCLKVAKCADNIPGTIVFSVWAGEPDRWLETKKSLARNVSELGSQWSGLYSPSAHVEKKARFIGILLLILVGLILEALRNKLPKSFSEKMPVTNPGSIWLVVIGWFLAAAGATSVLTELVELPIILDGLHARRDLALNVALGIVAGGACLLIREANEVFKKLNDSGGSAASDALEASHAQP